jgi:hypothetical protein
MVKLDGKVLKELQPLFVVEMLCIPGSAEHLWAQE